MASDKQVSELLTRCQYKYRDLAKRDILSTLSYFKELNLILDKYIYPNGQAKDLVTLNGTIPVSYKSNRYNIPVQLYLSDTHPYTPPLCYVRPTPDMSVNVSEHVDTNGRINLPCLREWQYPQSDIYVLLNLMTMKFSEQTPLFSKVNRPSNTPQYANQAGSLPYPVDSRPVYPVAGYNPTPYPIASNPYYPMPQGQAGPVSYLKSGSNNNLNRPASASYQASSYPDDTIKPEHYKMSLISAIQDKARIKYMEIESVKQAEIDSLKRVNQDLQTSEKQLCSFVNEAESEIYNVANLTLEVRHKTAQLNEKIGQMQHRDNACIEDAVVTPAPLYRQLMQLFAEELAIQDLVFYLSEGLQNKTISLDSFLKQVRFLSRKQFMLRATMQRARERAALPVWKKLFDNFSTFFFISTLFKAAICK